MRSSIVYRPGLRGSPSSTRVITAGTPDVPASATSARTASTSPGVKRSFRFPSCAAIATPAHRMATMHATRRMSGMRMCRNDELRDRGDGLLGLLFHDPVAGICDHRPVHIACDELQLRFHRSAVPVVASDGKHRHPLLADTGEQRTVVN